LEIISSIDTFDYPNPVVTVGTFDGVHKGHKKILDRLVAEAQKINGTPVVFTLKPHPRKVLFPEQTDLGMLNTPEEKLEKLIDSGVAVLIEYPFTKAFADYTSCEFIEEILFKKLKIKSLIIGYDHRFGKDRQGDPEILKACAAPFGFEVIKVDAYKENDNEISSTKIRKALEAGDLHTVTRFLGYEYHLKGTVTEGDKIGRTISFPTANIEITDREKLIPRKGVYAVDVLFNNLPYKGMLNIGNRPTVSNQKRLTVEVHIFDFNEMIYGKPVTLILNRFIREEQKFSTIEELKSQLARDKQIISALK
jgi:riboflavin kinase / FMN adenylyltransferase